MGSGPGARSSSGLGFRRRRCRCSGGICRRALLLRGRDGGPVPRFRSGQRQSTRRVPTGRFVWASGSPAAFRRSRNFFSSLLRVTWTSPRSTARSRLAPGVLGRRASMASTWRGVVRWRTPASWQARASCAASKTAARSTRVRAGVVTGISRHFVASLGWCGHFGRRRRALEQPPKPAAARPDNTAPAPHARTAAI